MRHGRRGVSATRNPTWPVTQEVPAAVVNAMFNATGVRVRDLPITLEKVLPGLPRVEV